jgi:formiminoglutamate deiminase
LRGRAAGATFWSWRDGMYAVAQRLDPDTYQALARATFAEMALAGITCVGEFHYLHHGPGGVPYDDPNELGHRLIEAAREAGIRITLLDTVYLSSTVDGQPLRGVQTRFGDGTVEAWSGRVERLRSTDHAVIGAAAHSVRAVPIGDLAAFAEASQAVPTHVHLSEQPAENEACLTAHGRTPTQLLHEHGLTGPRVTAVHATHLTAEDERLLGETGTGVCACPTTERDLGDGLGPFHALAQAGSPLSVGSDSQAVIDLFEEARGVELHERLRTGRRGLFTPRELLGTATWSGHRALGWPDAGRLAPGARADLVCVGLDSVRTAGSSDPESTAVFAATAADVRDVIVDGRVVVREGRHQTVDVAVQLRAAIEAAWVA